MLTGEGAGEATGSLPGDGVGVGSGAGCGGRWVGPAHLWELEDGLGGGGCGVGLPAGLQCADLLEGGGLGGGGLGVGGGRLGLVAAGRAAGAGAGAAGGACVQDDTTWGRRGGRHRLSSAVHLQGCRGSGERCRSHSALISMAPLCSLPHTEGYLGSCGTPRCATPATGHRAA